MNAPKDWIVQTIAMLRSGRICFAYCKQSTRTGNGSLPIQTIKIITKQRSGGYVSHIANYLHELETAACRGGIYA